jgi:hypothetical protein
LSKVLRMYRKTSVQPCQGNLIISDPEQKFKR